MPLHATSRSVIDVDGDGRADTGWLQTQSDGKVALGITTASGDTFSTPIDLAGGAGREALIADVDGSGTIIALAEDNRTADLFRISDCAFHVVTNAQGTQYQFDLGFAGAGTGVGCTDVTGDGVPDLTGLNLRSDASGAPVSIVRTAILLDGDKATNGPSDTIDVTGQQKDSPEVVSATSITCGNLTMTDDGISDAN